VAGIVRAERAPSGNFEAVWGGEFVVHSKESSRVVLVVRKNTVCGALASGTTLQDFDPSSFVTFGSKDASSAPLPKKLEGKEASEDILD
jgi:hypothetical protein